jgi:hypothetical protein
MVNLHRYHNSLLRLAVFATPQRSLGDLLT